VYDFVFTSQLPLTADLFTRLASSPFVPMFAWPAGQRGVWLGLGLGDVLLASAFPLVMGKAFGHRATVSAIAVEAVAIGSLLALPALNRLRAAFPVMVVLGPLMIAHYVYWRQPELHQAPPGVFARLAVRCPAGGRPNSALEFLSQDPSTSAFARR